MKEKWEGQTGRGRRGNKRGEGEEEGEQGEGEGEQEEGGGGGTRGGEREGILIVGGVLGNVPEALLHLVLLLVQLRLKSLQFCSP